MKAAIGGALLALMLCFPGDSVHAAREALTVWGLDVVPSLFPYMVFCRLLASRLRAAGIQAALAAPVLGLAGGSPSGAAVIAAYAGEGALSPRALRGLAALTGTISPMFLLGTVALWAKEACLGKLLLAANLFGAALAALVAYATGGNVPLKSTSVCAKPQDEDAITASVQAILGVGGCIVFFSVLASLPGTVLAWEGGVGAALLHAALEVSGGMHALLRAPLSPDLRAVLCAAAVGFGGVSILAQNRLFLRPLGLTLGQLAGFGLVRAAGAAGAMALLYPLLSGAP